LYLVELVQYLPFNLHIGLRLAGSGRLPVQIIATSLRDDPKSKISEAFLHGEKLQTQLTEWSNSGRECLVGWIRQAYFSVFVTVAYTAYAPVGYDVRTNSATKFPKESLSTSTRALQPVATSRQSPYVHKPAIIIMTSF